MYVVLLCAVHASSFPFTSAVAFAVAVRFSVGPSVSQSFSLVVIVVVVGSAFKNKQYLCVQRKRNVCVDEEDVLTFICTFMHDVGCPNNIVHTHNPNEGKSFISLLSPFSFLPQI